MCGENRRAALTYRPGEGSPPRVRGKRISISKMIAQGGITPACAGKTGNIFGLKELNEDHPRVCGENGAAHP